MSTTWRRWQGVTDADIISWDPHPWRYRFTHCDRCGKRRLFLRLYDTYRSVPGFGLVCADCLIEIISDKP